MEFELFDEDVDVGDVAPPGDEQDDDEVLAVRASRDAVDQSGADEEAG